MTSHPLRSRKLLFVVTEDWFFCSHFLPMARAAVGMGLDVSVATRIRAHRKSIEATGARVIALNEERGARGPIAAVRAIADMAAVLRTERPDIVHLIALKPVVVGGLAARLTGVDKRVYAVTGLGFVGSGQRPISKAAQAGLRALFKWALAGPQVRYLFENGDDPVTIGVDPKDVSRVTIVGGAGVSLAEFAAAPMPSSPPLRVAVVARMLWQKGVDLAVEAVQNARARGAAIELSLYGMPDLANPKSIAEADLHRWNALPGITWHGHSDDVGAIWANHHVCCLPSRGGEGLPRSILEAAACARPIVTTDVPGCRTFVQDGLNGLVVPPGDAGALAQALMALADDPDRLASMGTAARERVSDLYTEEAVSAAVTNIYRRLLACP